MKLNKKVMATLGALLVAVTASASAIGRQDAWFQKRAASMVVRRIERQLDLTDAQREQIRGILNQEEPTITALAAHLREENVDLSKQNAFDESAIRRICATARRYTGRRSRRTREASLRSARCAEPQTARSSDADDRKRSWSIAGPPRPSWRNNVGITPSGMGLAVSAPPSRVWCADQSASTHCSAPFHSRSLGSPTLCILCRCS